MRLIIVFLIIFFISCQNDSIYEKYHSFENNMWNTDTVVSFSVDIKDSLTNYDASLMIRHTTEYDYQNLFLFTQFSNLNDTLEIYLADKAGKWNGSGFGDVRELNIPFFTAKQLNFKNNSFHIEQAMRYAEKEKITNLKEIKAIGLRIRKSEK